MAGGAPGKQCKSNRYGENDRAFHAAHDTMEGVMIDFIKRYFFELLSFAVAVLIILAVRAPAEIVQAHGRAYVLVRVLSDELIIPGRDPVPAPGPSRRFSLLQGGRCPGGTVHVGAVRWTTRKSAGIRCVPSAMLR